MGRVRLLFPSSQYYAVVVPAVSDLGRWIMGLHAMYPGSELVVTKRDIASAFRLLRLRPSLSMLMETEFPSPHIPLQHDMVCICLAMPIGRNGAPGNCAQFGEANARAHLQCGLPRSTMRLNHDCRSVMYVDGGIFIELNMQNRLMAKMRCWEYPTV